MEIDMFSDPPKKWELESPQVVFFSQSNFQSERQLQFTNMDTGSPGCPIIVRPFHNNYSMDTFPSFCQTASVFWRLLEAGKDALIAHANRGLSNNRFMHLLESACTLIHDQLGREWSDLTNVFSTTQKSKFHSVTDGMPPQQRLFVKWRSWNDIQLEWLVHHYNRVIITGSQESHMLHVQGVD